MVQLLAGIISLRRQAARYFLTFFTISAIFVYETGPIQWMPSVATVLTMHRCVSRCLRVKDSTNFSTYIAILGLSSSETLSNQVSSITVVFSQPETVWSIEPDAPVFMYQRPVTRIFAGILSDNHHQTSHVKFFVLIIHWPIWYNFQIIWIQRWF